MEMISAWELTRLSSMTSSEDTLKDILYGKSAVYLVNAPLLRGRLVPKEHPAEGTESKNETDALYSEMTWALKTPRLDFLC
jgi:hypothetical protein